jgi:hypothetical protein
MAFPSFTCATAAYVLPGESNSPLAHEQDVVWQGPLQLIIFTLPERILIARFFPVAHIVKEEGACFWANTSAL